MAKISIAQIGICTRVLTAVCGPWRGLLLLAAVLILSAPSSHAQPVVGSRKLPLDHWAYFYVGKLRDRGFLEELNPLVQPYSRMGIARSLVRLNEENLREPEAGWVRLLGEELARELRRLNGEDAQGWGGRVAGGTRASTSQRFNVLQPVGTGGLWPNYRASLWLESGPIVFESRVRGDLYLPNDPDGINPHPRFRTDHAYVSVGLPFGELMLGRISRNWSALGTDGLMVSDNPHPYPQLGYLFKVGRFSLQGLAGELETIDGKRRYLAAHRVDYVAKSFGVSVGQSVMYATVNGGSVLRYINPMEIMFLEIHTEPSGDVPNLVLDWQLWYQTKVFIINVEVLLDDIDVTPQNNLERAPTRYAFHFETRLPALLRRVDLSMSYRQVSSFAYHAEYGVDDYSYLERGLGDNFSDYDLLTIGADWYTPLHGLRLGPILNLQRHGSGSFREPFPPYAEFRASPALFLGVKTITYRLGVRGRLQPNRFVWVEWDVGQNFVRNAEHVQGDNVSEFSARAEVKAAFDLSTLIGR